MKKKILIVDDDPTVIKFLAPLFSKKNYEPIKAQDGKEALQKIDKEPPDLIISDIMMPLMDGFELYRRLRNDPKTAQIPFIFLSAKDDPIDQLQGLRMGADEYLTKPFDATQLFVTIKNVLVNVDRAKSSTERVDFSGNLAEINLEDVVQLIEMNQKTGELIFTTYDDGIIGSVFFRNGRLVNAVTRSLEGEEAFFDLTTHKEGYVKFYSKDINVTTKISSQTMAMLFEAARINDESQTLYAILKDIDKRLIIKSDKIPPDNKTTESVYISKILKMIRQKKTVREIINSGEMSRPRSGSMLVQLINTGAVHLEEKIEEAVEVKIPKKVEKKYETFPIRIVTDSSVDLPGEMSRNRNITVIPLNIHFSKQIVIDGADVTPERFYTLMETSERAPAIFPVSYDEFHSVFKDIVSDMDILGIFMSQKLTRTYENVSKAVDHHYNEYSIQRTEKHGITDKPKIEIIDSKLVSGGMGLMVLEALEKINVGWPIKRVRKHIEELIPKVRILFFVNSPEYLNHNWRKGKGKILESIILNRKPILSMGKGVGEIEMVDQAKAGKDGLQRIERVIREDLLRYIGSTPIKAAVMQAREPQLADELNNMIKERFNCVNLLRLQIGSFVGAHCGPDVAGIAYYPVLE